MATAIKKIPKKAPLPEVSESGFDDAALASIQGEMVHPGEFEAKMQEEAGIGHNSGAAPLGSDITYEAREKLKGIVYEIERYEAEKKETAERIKEIYAVAKSSGYDAKALRAAVRRRAQDRQEREEFEAILDTYEHALEFYD